MKLLLATAAAATVAADFQGEWCGKVPFILAMDFTVEGDSTSDFELDVQIASTKISCPSTAIATSGPKLLFPNIETTGDCMGDALRSEQKDTSAYYVVDNGDGTLTFFSDGSPPLALKPCTANAKAAALTTKSTATMTKFMGLSWVDANPTHYGDPATGCQGDEIAVQVQGLSGDFCAPTCDGNTCPDDVPDAVTAKPLCALQTTSGDKYCALVCDPADASTCGTGSCKSLQGTGLCTYDDR